MMQVSFTKGALCTMQEGADISFIVAVGAYFGTLPEDPGHDETDANTVHDPTHRGCGDDTTVGVLSVVARFVGENTDIYGRPPVRDAAINRLRDWLTPLIEARWSVNWPHGLNTAIEHDPSTGATILTRRFVEHVTTYDNWSVGSVFLETFRKSQVDSGYMSWGNKVW